MKILKLQILLTSIIMLSYTTANAQGAEIARDLKSYIFADHESEGEGSSSGKKTHTIGGQEVDEVNSVVYKAFKMHPEWKNMTVVLDWTGSMYTYAGHIMRWHKINVDKKLLKNMVLFNDGDDNLRRNKKKEIGKTGGIYYADPNDLDDFLGKVEIAVDNGGGGDAEENDLEAIIAAVTKYDNANDIVLMADNSAIRDISLLYKIDRPVHVILCNGGYVYDYVKLAYETGGTIVTPNDDLDFTDKSKTNPDNIILNGVKYKIK